MRLVDVLGSIGACQGAKRYCTTHRVFRLGAMKRLAFSDFNLNSLTTSSERPTAGQFLVAGGDSKAVNRITKVAILVMCIQNSQHARLHPLDPPHDLCELLSWRIEENRMEESSRESNCKNWLGCFPSNPPCNSVTELLLDPSVLTTSIECRALHLTFPVVEVCVVDVPIPTTQEASNFLRKLKFWVGLLLIPPSPNASRMGLATLLTAEYNGDSINLRGNPQALSP